MGSVIVKRAPGKYLIWSTVVDDFITVEMTKDEMRNYLVEEAAHDVDQRIARFEMVGEGMTHEECVEIQRERRSQQ